MKTQRENHLENDLVDTKWENEKLKYKVLDLEQQIEDAAEAMYYSYASLGQALESLARTNTRNTND